MRRNGLTRDSNGKRTDKTGERDLTFNQWHREFLGKRCYTTDVDFFEYRFEDGDIKPKAFIEAKQKHVKQPKYLCSANSKAIFRISEKLNIDFFIILYERIDKESNECEFWVWEVEEMDDFSKYKEKFKMDKTSWEEFFEYYTNDEMVELLEGL